MNENFTNNNQDNFMQPMQQGMMQQPMMPQDMQQGMMQQPMMPQGMQQGMMQQPMMPQGMQQGMMQQSMMPQGMQQPMMQQMPGQMPGQPMMNNMYNYQTAGNTGKFNFFKYIIEAVLKPFDKFKSEENNLSDIKNVSILSAIIVGAMTIINLLSTMLSSVRVKSLWTNEVSWVWENLKNVEYFKVIIQNLLIYAGVIVAISGVYFLANLVIKRNAKFVKLLGAAVTAFIPYAIASTILSPILSMVYAPLGIGVTTVAAIYTLVILLELMNELIVIENKNTRIYFHLVCLSILGISGGAIAYNMIMSSIMGGLGSALGGLFG